VECLRRTVIALQAEVSTLQSELAHSQAAAAEAKKAAAVAMKTVPPTLPLSAPLPVLNSRRAAPAASSPYIDPSKSSSAPVTPVEPVVTPSLSVAEPCTEAGLVVNGSREVPSEPQEQSVESVSKVEDGPHVSEVVDKALDDGVKEPDSLQQAAIDNDVSQCM
jgi:hypothetical protein